MLLPAAVASVAVAGAKAVAIDSYSKDVGLRQQQFRVRLREYMVNIEAAVSSMLQLYLKCEFTEVYGN